MINLSVKLGFYGTLASVFYSGETTQSNGTYSSWRTLSRLCERASVDSKLYHSVHFCANNDCAQSTHVASGIEKTVLQTAMSEGFCTEPVEKSLSEFKKYLFNRPTNSTPFPAGWDSTQLVGKPLYALVSLILGLILVVLGLHYWNKNRAGRKKDTTLPLRLAGSLYVFCFCPILLFVFHH
jgi:hypothetical protein